MHNISLFNSTEFVGNSSSVGVFDYLLSHLNYLDDLSIFESIPVVVPNQAVSAWLKDGITIHNKICANMNFIILLTPVLQKIYLDNNPEHVFLDTNQIKFMIYEYLCSHSLDLSDGGGEVNQYLYQNNQLDISRVFLFATQLANIIQEYIYLRTDEVINLTKFPKWQQQLIRYILNTEYKTYIDIYCYFMNHDLEDMILPKRLFIFGITSLYPSQLIILKKLSNKINIFWYYQSPSLNYYGDLLSIHTKQKIEQKLLKYPNLTLDDLYLTDGNPILSTLGQQSREYIELLRSNDIEPFSINTQFKEQHFDSLLKLIQYDIKQINYRIDSNYRLLNNKDYYVDPVYIKDISSIKINSCHNKMREVQVMFNEIAKLLDTNPDYSYKDILITAPNIEDYVDLIEAVFDNEYLYDKSDNKYHILYNITGNKRRKNFAILECIQLILNPPYHLPVSYLIDVLSQNIIQNALDINQNDINKIKLWLEVNNIYFGYDQNDYEEYGFDNYKSHSLTSLLERLVLGSLTTNELDLKQLITYTINNQVYIPYHDLDFIDIKLINKLIKIVELLKQIRDIVYINNTHYQEHNISTYIDAIKLILNTLNIDISLDNINLFMEELIKTKQNLKVNLLIINQLINNYINNGNSRFLFNGKITVSSMHLMRSIPYKCVYVLGLNFGEFPKYFEQNKLSILAKEWYLADRNYYIEDKQIFLDIILAAQDRLYLSYIGRDEKSNCEIYPSPVLSLLIDTIGNSVTNFWNDKNDYSCGLNFEQLIFEHPLHPFSNKMRDNYSKYWQNVSKKNSYDYINLRWNFNITSPFKFTPDELNKYCDLSFNQFVKTFEYTNVNLFKVLDYDKFDNEIDLIDELDTEYLNKPLVKKVYQYINKYYNNYDSEQLSNYLEQIGIIGYQDIGKSQYNDIAIKHTNYQSAINDLTRSKFELNYTLKSVTQTPIQQFIINGGLMINYNKQIVIVPDFVDYCLKDEDIENQNKLYNEKIKYKHKLEALILLHMLKTNDFKVDGYNAINNQRIIYRDIRLDGTVIDKVFVLKDNTSNRLDTFFRYYLRSLNNPVLIVPKILKQANQNQYVANKKSPQLTKVEQLKTEFEKIKDDFKSDIFFDQIIDDYFNYTKNNTNVINDIINIFSYLEDLILE